MAPCSQLDGDRDFASGIEPDRMTAVARPDVVTGSLTDLDASSIAVSTDLASERGLALGSTVTVEYAGEERPLTVVATYTEDAALQSDATLSMEGFDALGVPPTDRTVYVTAEPGTDRAALRHALEDVVADLPTVGINDQASFAAEQREPIDQLLFIVYALLGLAVVIAVLGIINTLALSVIERVREIGLLRAVGLSRRQLRTMLRLESVAIALLGAVLGIVLGPGLRPRAAALARRRRHRRARGPGRSARAVRRDRGPRRGARGALARPTGGTARRAPGHRDRMSGFDPGRRPRSTPKSPVTAWESS